MILTRVKLSLLNDMCVHNLSRNLKLDLMKLPISSLGKLGLFVYNLPQLIPQVELTTNYILWYWRKTNCYWKSFCRRETHFSFTPPRQLSVVKSFQILVHLLLCSQDLFKYVRKKYELSPVFGQSMDWCVWFWSCHITLEMMVPSFGIAK